MANEARLLRLIDTYANRRDRLIEDTQLRIDNLLLLADFYDGDSSQNYATQAAMISAAAQAQQVFSTAAHQLSVMELAGVPMDSYTPAVPAEVRLYGDPSLYEHAKPVRRKTDLGSSQRLPAEEVWNRVARKYRFLDSKRADPNALDIARGRAKLYVESNLMLAEREAEAQVFSFAEKKARRAGKRTPKIVGYRRIIHPEKTKSGQSCGLCVAAADRVYSIKELRALHDHCKCQVLPITSVEDPGYELNARDLEGLYDEAGGTAASQLKKLRYRVEQHGELGPVLVSPAGVKIPYFSPVSSGASQAAA